MSTENERWLHLLTAWRDDANALWLNNQRLWAKLGLPDVSQLAFKIPNELGISELEDRFDWIDQEIPAFYHVTDGWKLFLGSLQCEILQVKDVNYFRSKYNEAFHIAIDSIEDLPSDSRVLSKEDLNSALLLSGPDAREIILSIESGETCLYQFDSYKLFSNFYEYMTYRAKQFICFLNDMLSN